MEEIKCPMCGKPNPAELDVCQYCEARLKPLTDELSRSQPPIHPGDDPVEQNTSELEPILPHWLRDVRQQARDSAEEESEQAPAEEEAPPPPEQSSEQTPDLLAGLQSQSKDDEEIPDWLTSLRGESVQSSVDDSSTDEDDLAALKSMFGEETPGDEESAESTLPGWISDSGTSEIEDAEETEEYEPSEPLTGQTLNEEPAQTEAQPDESESDFRWKADFDIGAEMQAASVDDAPPIDTGLPDWLKESDEESGGDTEVGLPDWMKTDEPGQSPPPFEGADSLDEPPQESAQSTAESDLPGWLASLGEESAEIPLQEETAQPSAEVETPDWLTPQGEESGEVVPQEETAHPGSEIETPDWLKSLGGESTDDTSQEAEQPAFEEDAPDWITSLDEGSSDVFQQEGTAQPTSDIETPEWLKSLGEESAEVTSEETEQPAFERDMPDWLSSLGDEGESTGDTVEETQGLTVEAETPDWLAALGEEPSGLEEFPGSEEEIHTPAIGEIAEEEEVAPVFTSEEESSPSTGEVDDIFSMDMPDWLSEANVVSQVEGEAPEPSPEAQEDDLRPAELPSWVQAMRPVEAVFSETEGAAGDQYVEEEGPFAGLRGVLPAVTGVGPTSKPEAYSIKLQASEEQQSGAALLEQILAAETNPKPMATQQVVLSQRFLRWIIAVVLLLVVGGSVFTGTQFNPLPTGLPQETFAALNYVQESLPADAPVLLIFDYDAAQAGEMEAAAAPLVDYMLLLKHPRLGMIASNPVGTGLAENFLRPFTLPTNHNYQLGEKFVNLGYLPGGPAGVLAFAENPVTAKPTSIDGQHAWETPALQGISQLSDFAAMILLTNDVETARIWIEQTESARRDTRLLVISSAQSGPMIMPYVQSGQVDGMVTGIDGSAPIERVNNGRPGTLRRYWDAYGFGLLSAFVMISLGALWSLVSGLRERRREQVDA